MLNILLVLASLAAIGAALMKFLEDAVLRNEQKASLQKRFQSWCDYLSSADRRSVALLFAKKISQTTDDYFGPGLISMRALANSSLICTIILSLALGLTGIRNGRMIGIAPWNVYRDAAAQVYQILSKKQPEPKTEVERPARMHEAFKMCGILARNWVGASKWATKSAHLKSFSMGVSLLSLSGWL